MTSSFCFFAKTSVNDEIERRCFVFVSDDYFTTMEIREIIWYALQVNEVLTFEVIFIFIFN